MRIGLVGPTYPFRGGIAHYTTLLNRALAERHDVCFVSFTRQYPGWLFPGKSDRDTSQQPLETGEVLRVIDSLNPLSWLRAARRLAEHEPELVIFQWWVAFWTPHFLTLARRLRARTDARLVFLCHNAVEHEASQLKILATRMVLSQADAVFTHAEAETQKIRQLLPKADVETAFHPTYEALAGTTPSLEEARAKLGVEGPVLLFFGFVRPYKGLDVLLSALGSVLERRQVTLLVVGEFWRDKESYERQIEEGGFGERVRMHDAYVPNEEIGTYFAAADLVVQPYRSASGSGICQLAYGNERPVIATRVGSLGEVVIDGVNGRLVPPEDPAALADAIVESLEPTVLEGLTAEAAKTSERFSWRALIDRLTGS